MTAYLRRFGPLLPALAVIGLFAAALSVLVGESLGLAGQGGFSLAKYERFLSDPFYFRYLTRSMEVAGWTTLVGLLLGYATAYAMFRSPRLRRILLVLLVFQFFAVTVTKVYALLLVLGNNGLINRALLTGGLVSSPLPIVNHELGVIVGLVNAALPFAVFPIFSSLAAVRGSLEEAAATLGAGRLLTFWKIIFPLSLPGVAAATVLVFLYSLGALLTPSLLGGGFVDMIASFAYEQALLLFDYGFAAAGSVMTLIAAFGLLLALQRCFRFVTPQQ